MSAEWEAALAAARARREREARGWRWRLVHWLHARRHPALHAECCSQCTPG